jgi:hypothetical protein
MIPIFLLALFWFVLSGLLGLALARESVEKMKRSFRRWIPW